MFIRSVAKNPLKLVNNFSKRRQLLLNNLLIKKSSTRILFVNGSTRKFGNSGIGSTAIELESVLRKMSYISVIKILPLLMAATFQNVEQEK